MGILAAAGIKKKVQFIKNENTVIEFEASLAETHSRNSTPTKFPIENGKNISDHMILEPFELSITLIITDHPISSTTGLITSGISTLTSKLTPPSGTILAGLGGLSLISSMFGNSPSVKAYEQILKIQEMGDPFTVLTSLKRYQDMVIGQMSVPREAQSGGSLIVTFSLHQLKIVRPKIVQISALANPGLSDALHDTGQQSTNDAFTRGKNLSNVQQSNIFPNGVAN